MRRSVSTRSPAAASRSATPFGVGVGVAHDRGDHDLDRRQPQRQAACVFLDQDADEALEGSEDGPVQHDRPVFLAVLADIGRVEPFRQHEIHLQRAALPVAPERVAQHELQLGAVEGAFARIHLEGDAGGLDRMPERRFGPVPGRVVAGAHRRPVGEIYQNVVEAEVAIDRRQQIAERLGLGVDLFPACRKYGRRPG